MVLTTVPAQRRHYDKAQLRIESGSFVGSFSYIAERPCEYRNHGRHDLI
jgi:hypothetical protein